MGAIPSRWMAMMCLFGLALLLLSVVLLLDEAVTLPLCFILLFRLLILCTQAPVMVIYWMARMGGVIFHVHVSIAVVFCFGSRVGKIMSLVHIVAKQWCCVWWSSTGFYSERQNWLVYLFPFHKADHTFWFILDVLLQWLCSENSGSSITWRVTVYPGSKTNKKSCHSVVAVGTKHCFSPFFCFYGSYPS